METQHGSSPKFLVLLAGRQLARPHEDAVQQTNGCVVSDEFAFNGKVNLKGDISYCMSCDMFAVLLDQHSESKNKRMAVHVR